MAQLGLTTKRFGMAGLTRSLLAGLLLLSTSCGIFVGNPEDADTGKRPPKQNPRLDPRVREKPVESRPSELFFALTDSPRDEVSEVYFTIAQLQIVSKGGLVFEIELHGTDRAIDLLSLQNGLSLALGSSKVIPDGEYVETRLTLGETEKARMVMKDGKEKDLKIKGNNVISVPTPFLYNRVTGLALTLDFDLRQSIVKEGKDYVLKPSVRLVQNHLAGGLAGSADKNAVICAYDVSAPLDTTTDCAGSVASATATDGMYKVSFLPEGSYNIRVYKPNGEVEDIQNVQVVAKKDGEVKPGPKPGPISGPTPPTPPEPPLPPGP